jgi:hypothetical protein
MMNLRIASVLCLLCGQAIAAEMAPLAPPVLGPLERPAKPLVLLSQPLPVTAYNPMSEGLVGGVMESITQRRFEARLAKTGEMIRSAMPNLDVTAEIRAGFRCGEAGSLCTETVVLPPLEPKQAGEDALRALLQSRQWSNARVLSTWWEQEKRSILVRASLTEIELQGDKLTWKHSVPVTYAITAPKGPGAVPHADEWDYGAPVPHEPVMRKAIHELEPMLQMALSWGVNNDPISKERVAVHARDQLRKYRPQGLECSSLAQCNNGFDSVVGDRVWVWHFIDTARNIKSYVMELQSRSRMDP